MHLSESGNQNNRKIVLVIMVFFLIQVLTIALYSNNWYLGSFEKMDNDDVKYIRSAWVLLESQMFTYHDINKPTVFIMPGYPFILAFFMNIFGKLSGIVAVRLFQGVLQTISLYLIYKICKELFNEKVALIAIVIDTLYIPEAVSTVLILTETVFKFLLILLIYITIKALKTKSMKYYFAGGVVWALSVMVRPTIALFPVVVFTMWLVYHYSIREMIVRTSLVLGIFFLIMFPWWIRNYNVFDRVIPFTLSSGNPFLQGTYINYNQSVGYTGYDYSDDPIIRDKDELDAGKQRLILNFRQNPIGYIYWYSIGKTLYFWLAPYYYKSAFGIPILLVGIYHISLLILALTGMIRLKYIKNNSILFLMLVVLYFTVVYLPYYTCSRYAYPVMPYIIILASNTLYTLAKNHNTKSLEEYKADSKRLQS